MARKNVSDELVCLAHREYKKLYEIGISVWPYQLLSAWTGEPEKVCYRAMERAYDRGYLEYGVSLRTAWLTKKGETLILGKIAPNKHFQRTD